MEGVMSFISRMTVKGRLISLLALPAATMVVLVVVASYIFYLMQLQTATIYNDRVVALKQLNEVMDLYDVHLPEAINQVNTGIISPATALEHIQSQRDISAEQWKSYLATYLTPEESVLAKEAESRKLVADQKIDELLNKIKSVTNPVGQFSTELKGMYEAVSPFGDKLDALVKLQLDVAKQEYEKADAMHDQGTTWFVAGSAVVLVITSFFGFVVYQSIVNPLNVLTHTMQTAERNSNLGLQLKVEGSDEISAASRAYNGMMQRFRGAMEQIMGVASQVASAAEEMSAVSEQTSQEIHRQQQETDRVATAMNEMAASVQEVAASASRSATSANEAEHEGKTGQKVVQEATQSIRNVTEQLDQISKKIATVHEDSQNISVVLDVIRSIADQTNLLALNAAIEAARAGEQGRGFAVVADEVRTLASRTQDSTREIAEMIGRLQSNSNEATLSMDAGVTRANESAELAGRAREALEGIARSLDAVNDMSTQIASATEEQSAVAEEINHNVVTIRDIGMSTASGAEQAAIASANLAQLATQLQGTVSSFRL
jgi:methyl-accepting chemotaxis protein